MKQVERYFIISDAAKQVQVESHVLRYWEEELKLPIKRNEMGHRFYAESDIKRFKEIKELKEQGLQLKAIRSMLKSGTLKAPTEAITALQRPAMQQQLPPSAEERKRHVVMVNKGEFVPISDESREAKNVRLQQLLQNMIAEAVRCNNQELCQDMKESLIKEMDYQFRLQEEREDEREEVRTDRQEEHYREIDELLRARNRRGRITKKGSGEREYMRDSNKKGEEAEAEKKDRMSFLRKKRSIN